MEAKIGISNGNLYMQIWVFFGLFGPPWSIKLLFVTASDDLWLGWLKYEVIGRKHYFCASVIVQTILLDYVLTFLVCHSCL